jgi:CubicO group peptidase (beta-lactamase class C family)
MVARHGYVVAEGWWSPYQKDDPHMLFSLSKSFTSTGIGLAAAEGRLTIDDPVLPYFPDDAPADPSANLKAMRVRDLLAMSTGHHTDDLQKFSFAGNERLTNAFLALPVAHKPGTHFLYNTPATYMLSAILQKATGTDLMDYLRPRLFEPLGIRNPSWEKSREGITLGGYGLKVTTEDIARFGQLYLRKGRWRGKPLVPATWVAAATARQTSNGSSPTSDWDQGYGYQFWRCRHGAYRGDGAFGQFCIVMPEQDAVVAITSGTRDLQGVLDLVWEHILGPMKAAPLAPDGANRARLGRKLAGLTLAPQPGRPVAASGARTADDTYTARLYLNETPFRVTASNSPMTAWCWIASTTSRWAMPPPDAHSSSARPRSSATPSESTSGSRGLRWRPSAACPRANRSARRARAG